MWQIDRDMTRHTRSGYHKNVRRGKKSLQKVELRRTLQKVHAMPQHRGKRERVDLDRADRVPADRTREMMIDPFNLDLSIKNGSRT